MTATTPTTTDRYVSFCGLDCDGDARRMMLHLDAAMAQGASKWRDYFRKKLAEKTKMGVDDLFFVGAQVNCLRAYLEEAADGPGLALLDQLEETCC
ncbi:N(2)-fixation sustaining protein CowN [Poseidonocella sp. HB161398]|uniref:N(2)-fixation sustaining protein CowN n=1 Tax=Poseidonocella sp. HB161398 TaxID=2320855 RepID=UPI00110848BA|nr:N(2)-fixation sustaining protein CowN [Poseidonocella sp. HB161398]